jgi:Flp pilus assembly protein TadG
MLLFRRFLKDERGASMIMVAVAMVMIFAFAVLAIDLSLIQLAKTQLQNAADAAALAGAIILFTSGGDQGAATAEAIRVAGLNVAVQDTQSSPSVIIYPEDVTFPGSDSITVTTHRTEATGDPVAQYFLRVLDPLLTNEGNVTAKATATIWCISGTDCLRPFCPPDRWDDVDSNGIWTPDDEYEDLNANGVWDSGEPLTEDWNDNGVWDPAESYHPLGTGYRSPEDIGTQITLKLNNSNQSPEMCFYYAVRFGPVGCDTILSGADIYEEWICPECEPFVVSIGDQLQMEPGKMVGPTNSGLECLIAMDPSAEWDPATGTVISSDYPVSPRIIKAPAFDPTLGVQNCHGVDCVTVTKIMVLFVEAHGGSGEIVGRFMTLATEGVPDPDCSSGSFLFTAALVR